MQLRGVFGPSVQWPRRDLISYSDGMSPELVLEGYRAGVFPMPIPNSTLGYATGWWSPRERGVLPLESLRVTRSMRQAAKRYRTTVDAAFGEVLRRCADPGRPDGWIDSDIIEVYSELHRQGVAHSVEAWTKDDRLAGGLYGVSLGGLFAGESMFHDPVIGRDASKVALMRLVGVLDADGVRDRIIDVQWRTDHLASLGVIVIDREEYLMLLDEVLALPAPDWTAAAHA